MDPLLTEDGDYYAPKRFDELINEKYILMRQLHISFTDAGKLTPRERYQYLKLIVKEKEKEKEVIDKLKK